MLRGRSLRGCIRVESGTTSRDTGTMVPLTRSFAAFRNKPSKPQTFTDYWIAGWRSQYRCPPASSPLSFRFGGPPSLSTLPVNW